MSESIQINNETLTFNKIWYVNVNNGSDTTGDGSESNPYETIVFCYENINDNDCIKLKDGTYTILNPYNFNRGVSFSIIGNNDKTKILSNQVAGQSLPTLKLYNLVWGYYNRFFNEYNNNIYGYNCVIYIRDYGNEFDNYFLYSNDGIHHEFYNCCLYTLHNSSTYQNYGKMMIIGDTQIKMVNCYYKDYYDGTTYYSNRSYNIDTSLIRDVLINSSNSLTFGTVGSPNIDEHYNITSSGWRNIGTGQNPDGSQAHIGVYGGPYAWGKWKVKINSINYNIINN